MYTMCLLLLRSDFRTDRPASAISPSWWRRRRWRRYDDAMLYCALRACVSCSGRWRAGACASSARSPGVTRRRDRENAPGLPVCGGGRWRFARCVCLPQCRRSAPERDVPPRAGRVDEWGKIAGRARTRTPETPGDLSPLRRRRRRKIRFSFHAFPVRRVFFSFPSKPISLLLLFCYARRRRFRWHGARYAACATVETALLTCAKCDYERQRGKKR